MTMILKDGAVYLSGGRDKDGFRNWKVKHLVLSDEVIGPATALLCPGLPQPGQMWLFNDDVDPWAFCTLEASVTPYGNTPHYKAYWVEQPFTSAPNTKWCKDKQVDDPLLQPPKITGNFIRYTEEATYDRFGAFIKNSSHEQIRGPQVEFDADRIQIEIEQNVVNLDLPLLIALDNTVNGFELWGAAPRTIKFTPGQWSMNFYGTCHRYFTRKLIFEAKKEGWDRAILDEGTRVLNGHWPLDKLAPRTWTLDNIGGKPPDPRNPTHFIRYKDPYENMSRTVLDGAGKPFIPELVTTETDCDGQPKAPTKWLVNGLVSDDVNQSPVILNYSGACNWVGSWEYKSGSTKIITLAYIPLDSNLPSQTDEWRLTIEGVSLNQPWTLKNRRWKYLGPNTLNNEAMAMQELMYKQDTGEAPENIYPVKLSVISGNMPGVRVVQKYENADFLLLGIPIDL